MKSDSKISWTSYSPKVWKIIGTRGDYVDQVMEELLKMGYQEFKEGDSPEHQLKADSVFVDFNILSGLHTKHPLTGKEFLPEYHEADPKRETWCEVGIYTIEELEISLKKFDITNAVSAARKIDTYVKEALSQLKQ